jgi:hypothetical protein
VSNFNLSEDEKTLVFLTMNGDRFYGDAVYERRTFGEDTPVVNKTKLVINKLVKLEAGDMVRLGKVGEPYSILEIEVKESNDGN